MKQSMRKTSYDFASVQNCPLCGSQRLRRRFDVRHITDDPHHTCGLELGFFYATVLACNECQFVFKLQQPSSEYLNEYYSSSDEHYLENLAEEHGELREDFRKARLLLNEGFPGGGKILDVGCASGFFLQSLGSKWKRFGIELFHLAAERARQRQELTIRECDLQTAGFADQTFDVVCSFDVIEHLPDPIPMLRESRRILRPGGWLILGTGDCGSISAHLSGSRWTYFCFAEHLSFFSSRSLRSALRSSGFSRCRFTRIHHGERTRAVTTGWARAVAKHWAVELFGTRVFRLDVFRQKTTQFLVPYFHDHMLCVAR